MSKQEVSWVPVAVFAAGYEADLALAQLESGGILAVRRDNDTVGIFGPGFQGATARGVAVLVPSDAVAEAKDILEPEAGAD